ncbi:MAG: hypothetical protein LBI20_00520 [Holosporales bacterium]|jgi:hypothetical protein|nr:hypothetical protein [Holosporales bacterium]
MQNLRCVFFIAIFTWVTSGKIRAMQDEEISMPLAQLLAFKNKFPEFNYGIRIMEGIYNVTEYGQIPPEIYSKKISISRRVILLASMALEGAKGAIARLSIFHPDRTYLGTTMIGLRIGSAILRGVDYYLKKLTNRIVYHFLGASNSEPANQVMPDFPTLSIHEKTMRQLFAIMNTTMRIVDPELLSIEERNLYDRLLHLYNELFDQSAWMKVALYGGRLGSFLCGTASGCAIATSGQDSPPSYYLTLASGAIDPFVGTLIDAMDDDIVAQRYIDTSELIYLAEMILSSIDPMTVV